MTKEIHVSKEEIKEGRKMGIVCYLFALIPYLSDTENNFIKFHAREGMNLLLVTIILGVLDSILKPFVKVKICSDVCAYTTPIGYDIVSLIFKLIIIAFIIYGISNVLAGKTKHLPLISKINLFK